MEAVVEAATQEAAVEAAQEVEIAKEVPAQSEAVAEPAAEAAPSIEAKPAAVAPVHEAHGVEGAEDFSAALEAFERPQPLRPLATKSFLAR